MLTGRELRDGVVIAAATVIVLPWLPDRGMGPFQALNPHDIWLLIVMLLGIGAFGQVATRLVGARWGLPVSGLISGFASSIATIAALGARAKATPSVVPSAVAGALLSTIATIMQLGAVLALTDPQTLRVMALPLAAAGSTALLVGAIFTLGHLPRGGDPVSAEATIFDVRGALIFAAVLSAVLLVSAGVTAWLGEGGLLVAAGVAGLADGHAPAISAASLAVNGQISRADAVWPILVGLTTNTMVKMAVAAATGGGAFAIRVAPGLIVVLAAGWLGAILPRL